MSVQRTKSAIARAQKERRARDDRKRNARSAAWRPPCPNCGQPGPHFVPPAFGEPGFFACPTRGAS